MSDGKLVHETASSTAASAGNPLFGPSGTMTYRVTVQGANGGFFGVDVDADSGDAAAALALQQHPGCKVGHVEPAPPKRAKAA